MKRRTFKMERWELSRAGYFNYWYFNDWEVFQFINGHLMLTGSNSTGKSMTTATLIPYLLDANKNPKRFDPLGSSSRLLGSIVLGKKGIVSHNSRTGYKFLEYRKPTTNQFITSGVGLYAEREKEATPKFWGFLIFDNRRLGIDIKLFHEDEDGARIPLSEKELKELIGDGGIVTSEPKEYMALVNRHIYGFPTIEAFDDLIKVLLKIREPLLGSDFKLNKLYQTLGESLPPLSQKELEPLKDTVEKLGQIQEELKVLTVKKQAVDQFCRHYEGFNRQNLYKLAKHFSKSFEQYKKDQGEIEKLNKKQIDLQKDIKVTSNRLDEIESLQRAWNEEKKILEQNQDIRSVSDSKETTNQRLENVKETITNIDKKVKAERLEIENQNSIIQGLRQQKQLNQEKLKEQIFSMEQNAKKAYFLPHEILARDYDDFKDEDKLTFFENIQNHESRLNLIYSIYQQEEQAQNEKDRASNDLKKVQEREDQLEAEQSKMEKALDVQRSEWIRQVTLWSDHNKFLKLPSDVLKRLEDYIDLYPDKLNKEDLLQSINEEHQQTEKQLKKRHDQLHRQWLESDIEVGRLKKKLRQCENEEPTPSRSLTTETNRRKLLEAKVLHIPFYRAVQFKKGIERDVQNRLEAALEESGLLDALIVPNEHHHVTAKQNDRILIPKNSTSNPSLEDYLEPETNVAIDQIYIKKILSSISIRKKEKTSTVIQESGDYEIGLIEGTAPKYEHPRFIGQENRDQYWKDQKRKLRDELIQEEQQRDQFLEDLQYLEKSLESLGKELNGIPSFVKLDECHDSLRNIYKEREDVQEDLKGKSKIFKDYFERHKRVLDQLHFVLSGFPFQSKSDVQEAEKNIRIYLRQWMELQQKLEDKQRLIQDLKHTIQSRNEKEKSINSSEEQKKSLKEEETTLKAQLDALNKKLKELGGDDLSKSVEELNEKIKDLVVEHRNKTTNLLNMQTNLDQTKEKHNERLKDIKWTEFVMKQWHQFYQNEQQFQPHALRLLESESQNINVAYEHAKNVLKGQGATDYLTLDYINEKFKYVYDQVPDYRPTSKKEKYQLEEDLAPFEPLDQNQATHWEVLNQNKIRLYYLFEYQSTWISPFSLQKAIDKEVKEKEDFLGHRENVELFQEVILKNLGHIIRRKIRQVDKLIDNMNQTMSCKRNIHGGLQLKLRWRANAAESENELHIKDLVELLSKDVAALKPAEYDQLLNHFKSLVERVRNEHATSNNHKPFGQLLAEAMDYRKWFSFSMKYKKKGIDWTEFTRNNFGELSTGERILSIYMPLLAAVHARYQDANPDCPLIVIMDEAFMGISDENIAEMFQLLEELGFNYIMNSQNLKGDYETVSGIATYELIRPDNQPYVAVYPLLQWYGKKKS